MESKHEKTARKISQEDLDESVKQGNTWVAIHNKVYDLTLMKEQAQCGAMLIEYYAGMSNNRLCFSIHHVGTLYQKHTFITFESVFGHCIFAVMYFFKVHNS